MPVAKQILSYPMLDDRNTTPGAVPAELLTWSYDNNYTGWVTLLGDALARHDVSPVASPARLTNFAGLPPAYIDVGDLDIFRDESISYALGLAKAGVPIELHVHPGAPHGFERGARSQTLGTSSPAESGQVRTHGRDGASGSPVPPPFPPPGNPGRRGSTSTYWPSRSHTAKCQTRPLPCAYERRRALAQGAGVAPVPWVGGRRCLTRS
jgi:acetyl esterase/lipase